MIGALIIGLLILSLGAYAIFSYIYYRIVRKFENTISYREMLIPFWNIYLINKIALGKPYAIPYFWICLILSSLLSVVSNNYNQDIIIVTVCNILITLTWAIPIALIAQKLGKNPWIYFVLLLVPTLANKGASEIITVIILSILAFDKSVSTPPNNEEEPNNTTLLK